MLLVVTYSQAARMTLRNICRAHDEVVVRQLGYATPFDETELTVFLALRLREKHNEDIQIKRAQPSNEFAAVPDAVRKATAAYEDRESPATPYGKFASGTDHPSAAEMQHHEL